VNGSGGPRRCFVVVDLGFGDSGKGTIADYLVRREGAELVVRYNGGAQAGHNVVTDDGRHHTFAQFGAGTFVEGCRTHLAETVVVHPSALVVEERYLEKIGVSDAWERITISPEALVTTPFHQSLGRLRELARDKPHGTCGVGVGETMRAAGRLAGTDWIVRMRHLLDADLDERVEGLRRALLEEALSLSSTDGDERRLLEDRCTTRRWIESMGPLLRRAREVIREAPEAKSVVLEGAQGILLDEDWGFHPHTTWSKTTDKHAVSWARGRGFSESETVTIGVVRSYLTRHGAGPFPSERTNGELDVLAEPHNGQGGWQGRFRRGWPDPILLRYAIRANVGVDALAVTHLDALARMEWRGVRGYEGSAERALEERICADDFSARERRTEALGASRVVLERVPNDEAGFVAWLEERLETPVTIGSMGPTASMKVNWRDG
jgi:adenylosuccinate synthase